MIRKLFILTILISAFLLPCVLYGQAIGISSSVALHDSTTSAQGAKVSAGGDLYTFIDWLSSDVPATWPLPTGAATQTTLASVLAQLVSGIAVTGTFWQATQPVSGSVTANIGTSGSLALAANQTNVQSAAGTGTSTAITIQGNASGIPIPISGSITATNPSVGTTGSAVPTSATLLGAKNGPNIVALSADGSNNLNVNLQTALPTGNNNIGFIALNAGTASVGTIGLNAGSNTIGAVTQASGPWTDNITQFGGATLTIGQQVAANSIPVILPSATITTLTPPAAITGFSTSANQTNGSQKTQIVDGSGNVIGSTGNALNISIASGNPTSITTNAGTNTSTANLALDSHLTQIQTTPGSATPADVVQIGGSDGTNLRALKTTTGGNPLDEITDGTTTANVSPSGSAQNGQNYLQTGNTFQTFTYSPTTAGTSSAYDLQGIDKAISIQMSVFYTGQASVTWQGSNDNSHFQTFVLLSASSTGANAPTTSNSTFNNTVHGNCPFRYLEIVVAGTGTSGTATITTIASSSTGTNVAAGAGASQVGTWTMQPGNTPNTSSWNTFSGGQTTTTIAAGTTGNTVVKNAATHLMNVLVTSAATGAVSIYDNSTTNSGTIIGYIPATAVAGSMYTFNMPCANGITVAGAAANPAMTISFGG